MNAGFLLHKHPVVIDAILVYTLVVTVTVSVCLSAGTVSWITGKGEASAQ